MSTGNGLLAHDRERGASGTNWNRPGIAVAGSVAVLGALLMWPGTAGAAPLPAECVQADPVLGSIASRKSRMLAR